MGRFRDVGPWAVDRGDARLQQEIIILRRDDAAANHDDVVRPCLLQLLDQRRDERKGRIGDQVPAEEISDQFPPEREAEAGMTVGEVPGGETTMDDLAPETQIPDDGSRSPRERGHGGPADQDLSVVSEHEIGADVDRDEAELGRYDPLDGKPWDGPAKGDEEDRKSVV